MNDQVQNASSSITKQSIMLGGLALLVVTAWVWAASVRGGYSGDKDIMAGWEDRLPAGQQVAEAEDKPMIVLFTASWCAPCQKLKKNVLQDEAVRAELAKNYVPVQIDLSDQSRDNPNRPAAMKYGVSGIPTLLALKPDGTLITQYPVTGRDTPADLALWLQTIEPISNAQAATAESR